MDAREQPAFASDASRRIYEYVERHGTAERRKLPDIVSLPSEEFRTCLEQLKSDGYLEEENGTLRIALEFGAIEKHELTSLPSPFAPVVSGTSMVSSRRSETLRPKRPTSSPRRSPSNSCTKPPSPDTTRCSPGGSSSRLSTGMSSGGPTSIFSRSIRFVKSPDRQLAFATPIGARGSEARSSSEGSNGPKRTGIGNSTTASPSSTRPHSSSLTAHGWNTEAIRKDHYTIDGEYVDEVMMAYEL